MEEAVRQGVPLLEVIEQTKHLRARDGDEPEERVPAAASPAAPPPPNMAALGDFERWNQMRGG